jgi:hypothetical protein
VSYDQKDCAVFISRLQTSIIMKKFKHTNEELELAKLQTEKEKKEKESQE